MHEAVWGCRPCAHFLGSLRLGVMKIPVRVSQRAARANGLKTPRYDAKTAKKNEGSQRAGVRLTEIASLHHIFTGESPEIEITREGFRN